MAFNLQPTNQPFCVVHCNNVNFCESWKRGMKNEDKGLKTEISDVLMKVCYYQMFIVNNISLCYRNNTFYYIKKLFLTFFKFKQIVSDYATSYSRNIIKKRKKIIYSHYSYHLWQFVWENSFYQHIYQPKAFNLYESYICLSFRAPTFMNIGLSLRNFSILLRYTCLFFILRITIVAYIHF